MKVYIHYEVAGSDPSFTMVTLIQSDTTTQTLAQVSYELVNNDLSFNTEWPILHQVHTHTVW